MFNYIKEVNGTQVFDVVKISLHAISAILALVLIFNMFGTVGAGQRGVHTSFGAVSGRVYGEGLTVKLPFVESIVKLDVKTQKEEVSASAASKDLQTVNSQIALNYSLNPERVASIYQNIGKDYKERLIAPAIQESVKASTAKFTAEELVTKREEVSQMIRTSLDARLTTSGIRVEGLSIINFDFSKSFNAAIEAKVTAEQDALAAKNKLAQVEYEAQQAVESAKGRAEALRIESAAISSNPKVLELRAIEKWNGVLPTVTGSSVPFISLPTK